MVPMAPSSTRMRSAASWRSVCSRGDGTGTDIRTNSGALALGFCESGHGLLALRRALRPQSQQMADRVDEVGAVHGVEVEVGDAAIDQIEHLLGGDRGGDELAGRGVLVEAVDALRQPIRQRGAAARGEILGLLEILHPPDTR